MTVTAQQKQKNRARARGEQRETKSAPRARAQQNKTQSPNARTRGEQRGTKNASRTRAQKNKPQSLNARALGQQNSARVRVALGARGYDIELGAGILDGLGPALARRFDAPRVALISTPPVARRYAARVMRSLGAANLKAKRFETPDGERHKNLRAASRLYEALLQAGADRATLVVALGGGVVGDLAGFVAATLLRGLRVVQVPTTLLAMVDSSIGGKTGVNLARGKNLVGAFHQPSLVWADVETLRTLPPRQVRAGLAEVVKHAAIRDARLFARLERDCERLLALDARALLPVLTRNCRIKADIVRRDEREAGPRRLLNFGHTLGHAVETLARYRGVLHGEAVAIGMAYAAAHSARLGFCARADAARLCALLTRIGLPLALPPHSRAEYLRALAVDKKKARGGLHFIALRSIGRASVELLTPSKILPPSALRRRRG